MKSVKRRKIQKPTKAHTGFVLSTFLEELRGYTGNIKSFDHDTRELEQLINSQPKYLVEFLLGKYFGITDFSYTIIPVDWYPSGCPMGGEKRAKGRMRLKDMKELLLSCVKREIERDNIDDVEFGMENSVLCGSFIPRDVMKHIFKFCVFDRSFLLSVGGVNSLFYFLILSNWSGVVTIDSRTRLYQTSLLVLRGCKKLKIVFDESLDSSSFEHLFRSVTPELIRSVELCSSRGHLNFECSVISANFYEENMEYSKNEETRIETFFTKAKETNIVFSQCASLHFQEELKDVFGRNPSYDITDLFPNVEEIVNPPDVFSRSIKKMKNLSGVVTSQIENLLKFVGDTESISSLDIHRFGYGYGDGREYCDFFRTNKFTHLRQFSHQHYIRADCSFLDHFKGLEMLTIKFSPYICTNFGLVDRVFAIKLPTTLKIIDFVDVPCQTFPLLEDLKFLERLQISYTPRFKFEHVKGKDLIEGLFRFAFQNERIRRFSFGLFSAICSSSSLHGRISVCGIVKISFNRVLKKIHVFDLSFNPKKKIKEIKSEYPTSYCISDPFIEKLIIGNVKKGISLVSPFGEMKQDDRLFSVTSIYICRRGCYSWNKIKKRIIPERFRRNYSFENMGEEVFPFPIQKDNPHLSMPVVFKKRRYFSI